jgi:hypothetical protein
MEVSKMKSGHQADTAPTTGSQDAAGPFNRVEFMKNLSATLGQRVQIVPMCLPDVCACLWLGFAGLDRIWFNPDWPGHELTLTAHAIGHLALGHCGTVRDGGQFACLPADAPGRLPKELNRRITILASATMVYRLPWVREWRLSETTPDPLAAWPLAMSMRTFVRYASATAVPALKEGA